jgi:hypothetical protein
MIKLQISKKTITYSTKINKKQNKLTNKTKQKTKKKRNTIVK